MIKTAKSNERIFSEPIICDVRVPIEKLILGQPDQTHQGNVIVNIERTNTIKNLLIASAIYQKIELPYRFTITSAEIIYEKKHIKSVRLAGSYLSGIDAFKVEAQLSNWKTQPPPETYLDDDFEIAISEEFSRQCYFVMHRSGEEFQIDWNLADILIFIEIHRITLVLIGM